MRSFRQRADKYPELYIERKSKDFYAQALSKVFDKNVVSKDDISDLLDHSNSIVPEHYLQVRFS